MPRIVSLFLVFTLLGCAAKPLLPGANLIVVSRQPASEDCEHLGEVMGTQGNLISADFTSDLHLIQGARNEMRNQAMYLGANYVVLETESHSENTGEGGLGGTYSSVVIGNAYSCPDSIVYKVDPEPGPKEPS